MGKQGGSLSEKKEDSKSHGRVSSSTPKTQHRYQEYPDEEESSQHNFFMLDNNSGSKNDERREQAL